MNFFSKNRLVFWIFIVLILINVSALVTFYFYSTRVKEVPACCSEEEKSQRALSNELGLTDGQSATVAEINNAYREKARPIAMSIRETRELILAELEKATPDTAMITQWARSIATLQMGMQQQNIKQYLELKKVCTPQQAQRLSSLYRDLYGCPMQENKMRHQYRRGQCASDSMKCN